MTWHLFVKGKKTNKLSSSIGERSGQRYHTKKLETLQNTHKFNTTAVDC
jgi:hypothetical protein